MSNKEEYTQLCEQHPEIPIFQQYWWMSAVCAGKEWDVILSRNADGIVIAAMPYLIRKRLWMRYILMPQQTQIGGIWIREQEANNVEQVANICEDIAHQLESMKLHYYSQNFAIASPATKRMEQIGFHLNKRISYRIEDLSDLNQVIDRFSKNKKRQLQKALSLHVDYTMGEEDFYNFHAACLNAQKKTISYTREFFLVIFHKTQARKLSRIICIKDADGRVLAAAFLVWDQQSLYYLIPCYDIAYKESGAGSLLVLEAIKVAREQGVAFDFEGSMIPGVANHYKQFGSIATTYYEVRRYYHRLFALALFANWLRNRL